MYRSTVLQLTCEKCQKTFKTRNGWRYHTSHNVCDVEEEEEEEEEAKVDNVSCSCRTCFGLLCFAPLLPSKTV